MIWAVWSERFTYASVRGLRWNALTFRHSLLLQVIAALKASLIIGKAKITGAQAGLATLPQGPAKLKQLHRLRRLVNIKTNLEPRITNGGSVALVDTEIETTLLVLQIVGVAAFIAQVNTKKTTF